MSPVDTMIMKPIGSKLIKLKNLKYLNLTNSNLSTNDLNNLPESIEILILSKNIINTLGPIAGVTSDNSYTGDSILNSTTDIIFHLYGWYLANKYDTKSTKKINEVL